MSKYKVLGFTSECLVPLTWEKEGVGEEKRREK